MQHRLTSLSTSFPALLIAVLVVTSYRLLYLDLSPLPLFFDEAQYWFWAKTPDWGYYSKPPVVAWIIGMTTAVCGNGEFCVRLGSPLLHAGTTLLIYGATRRLFGKEAAMWAGMLYLTLPGVTISSSVISTDPPFMFFWALAFYGFTRALEHNGLRWWVLTGLAAGFGMLSKYTMLLFLVSAVLYLLLYPPHRKYLTHRHFWIGTGIAAFLFLPNILWNAANGFVSFLHTKDNAALEETSLFHPSEMAEFVAAQFGVFGPVLFGILLWQCIQCKTLRHERPYVLTLSFVLPLLGMITVIALLSRAHANWAAPVYVTATIAVAGWAVKHHKERLLQISLVLHLLLMLCFMQFEPLRKLAGFELSGKKTHIAEKQIKDPFERLKGLDRVGMEIAALLKHYPDAVLLADERKTLAVFLYYIAKENNFSGIVPFVKWNEDDHIEDHYELVSDMNAYHGRKFLYITRDTKHEEVLNHFSKQQRIRQIIVPLYKDEMMVFDVFLVE
jgi:hypothetical protein